MGIGELGMDERRPGTWSEFADGWRVLLGATFGVGLGIAGLLTYNLGLFTTDLEREVGLGPAAYGGALLGLNLALAAAMPFVGRRVDRFGSRTIATAGAAILAAGFFALSRTQSVAFYVVVLAAIGFCASLSAPVAHTRAVAARFARRRGLALGITQVGIGLAAALVPRWSPGKSAAADGEAASCCLPRSPRPASCPSFSDCRAGSPNRSAIESGRQMAVRHCGRHRHFSSSSPLSLSWRWPS
jgi:hypothetical protein